MRAEDYPGLLTLVLHYGQCVDWLAEGDEDLEEGSYTRETMDHIEQDGYTFYHAACHLLDCKNAAEMMQAGHDHYLSRNETGAGFQDGYWGDRADALEKISKSFGPFELYMDDDKWIHFYAPGARR